MGMCARGCRQAAEKTPPSSPPSAHLTALDHFGRDELEALHVVLAAHHGCGRTMLATCTRARTDTHRERETHSQASSSRSETAISMFFTVPCRIIWHAELAASDHGAGGGHPCWKAWSVWRAHVHAARSTQQRMRGWEGLRARRAFFLREVITWSTIARQDSHINIASTCTGARGSSPMTGVSDDVDNGAGVRIQQREL
jgi:hypothetical protein